MIAAFQKPIILALLSGILLALAMPPLPTFLVVFIAFLPILYIEGKHSLSLQKQTTPKKRFPNLPLFGHGFIAFFVWNLLATWWVAKATIVGMLIAVIGNALLMSGIVVLYSVTKRKLGTRWGYCALIAYWISFEYLHFYWQLSWPWLTLGNLFATFPELIQWYEFTGVFGGSLWVLTLNILLYHTMVAKNKLFLKVPLFVLPLSVFILPILVSLFMYANYDEKGKQIETVIVQPNIKTLSEKFETSPDVQIRKMLTLAEPIISPQTQYVILPETAIPEGIWMDDVANNEQIILLDTFLKKHPHVTIVAGMYGFEKRNEQTKDAYSQQLPGSKVWYNGYNTALQIHTNGWQHYHKTRLVPGAELIPYLNILPFMRHFSLNLAGDFGSMTFGRQEDYNFLSKNNVKIATPICYESIYGDLNRRFVKAGADFLMVITNDGWWEGTAGYRQLLYYTSLRAIETRRSIARSANTGISGTFDQTGKLSNATQYGETKAFAVQMTHNDSLTFYVKYGDWIAQICCLFMSLVLLPYLLFKKIKP